MACRIMPDVNPNILPMKPGWKMLWTLIAAVALVIAAWLILRPTKDPLYQGRRLSVWFDQYQHARTSKQSERAKEAIKKIGPAAVPYLIDRLRARDSYWRKRYPEFYFSHVRRWPRWIVSRLPAPHQDTAEMTRLNAVTALGWLGDAAKSAAPELAMAMSDESSYIGFVAGRTLVALGPSAREVMPTMIEALRSKNPHNADNAANVIASVARNSPDVIPLLTSMLGDHDAVTIRVLRVLSQLGRTAASAERDIESLVASTNENVRFAAIKALWDIFPSRHIELLPKLEDFAQSPHETIRESVGSRLVRMQPLTERAAELLTVVVRNGSESFCWATFTTLGTRAREASNGIPVLIEGLNGREPRAVARAAAILGDVAQPHKETLSALEKARQHDYLMVRDAADEAIQKIQSRPD